MADPLRWPMTPEEFFERQLGQEVRSEIVDDSPALRHRMKQFAARHCDREHS